VQKALTFCLDVLKLPVYMATRGHPECPRLQEWGQFAAWLGLTPRQYSSRGKTKLGRISRRGMPACAACCYKVRARPYKAHWGNHRHYSIGCSNGWSDCMAVWATTRRSSPLPINTRGNSGRCWSKGKPMISMPGSGIAQGRWHQRKHGITKSSPLRHAAKHHRSDRPPATLA